MRANFMSSLVGQPAGAVIVHRFSSLNARPPPIDIGIVPGFRDRRFHYAAPK